MPSSLLNLNIAAAYLLLSALSVLGTCLYRWDYSGWISGSRSTALPVVVLMVLVGLGIITPVMGAMVVLSAALVWVAGTGASSLLALHLVVLVGAAVLAACNLTLATLVLIDLLSLIQAVMVLSGLCLPYLLFQAFTSVCLWVSVVNGSQWGLVLSVYSKLGLGIGALYLPGLYRGLALASLPCLAYVGCANLTLLLLVPSLGLVVPGGQGLGEHVWLAGPLSTMVGLCSVGLPLVWLLSGTIYVHILPYTLAVSSTAYAGVSYLTLNADGQHIHAFILTGAIAYSCLVFTLLPSSYDVFGRGVRGLEVEVGPSKVSNGALLVHEAASPVGLMQATRIEYGGRNSTLCSFFPVLFTSLMVHTCYMLHCSHPIGSGIAVVMVGWLVLVTSYVVGMLNESRLVSSSSWRAGSLAAFACLICLELSFFFGAIWSLSVTLTHSGTLSPSLSSNIGIEVLSSQSVSLVSCPGVGSVVSPAGLGPKMSECLHLAYSSLGILLAVTLVLQMIHRNLQMNHMVTL